MSVLATLLLLQPTPMMGAVPVQNEQLDAAHACLISGTQEIFRLFDWKPEESERWRWAMRVVDACDAEIKAAAQSKETHSKIDLFTSANVSRHSALRSEAAYFVDGLIRERFETGSEDSE